MRVAAANFVKDDLAKVGIRVVLTPVDFNTLVTNFRSDFQYEAILLGLQSGVPPSPANGQNMFRSAGETHLWFARQQKPATPEEARIDQLMDEILIKQDRAEQKRCVAGVADDHERAELVHPPSDHQDQSADQQPIRQRAAQHHVAPDPLERRAACIVKRRDS